MHIQPFRASYPIFEQIPDPDAFCADAKNAFQHYLDKGSMTKTGRKALYVYQIDDGHRQHTGLVALNEVRDFFAGKVKKHEKTLSERERQHLEMMLNWGAVIKPVLLTFPPIAALTTWMQAFTRAQQPFLQAYFAADSQTHRLWLVAGADDIRFLQDLFVQHIPGVYIADGHHRTTTMAQVSPEIRQEYPRFDFDHLFCAFFPADQLDIHDYNRVVDGLGGLRPAALHDRLSSLFHIEPVEHPRKPRHKFELKMFLDGHWYRLQWKPEVLEQAARNEDLFGPVLLDVSLLNELVLRPILGIGDVRTDGRILYVEGSRGLNGIRKTAGKGADRVGFALHPVDFGDLMQMADAGESLPPKSTFFEPRMRSGLLVRMLADR